jgi:hypothetical protein
MYTKRVFGLLGCFSCNFENKMYFHDLLFFVFSFAFLNENKAQHNFSMLSIVRIDGGEENKKILMFIELRAGFKFARKKDR